MKLAILTIIIDFIFLVASFSGIHFVKNGNLEFSLIHRELFIIIIFIWAFVYLIYRKLAILSDSSSFYRGIAVITKSNIIIAFILSFTIVAFHLMAISRIQAYGSCLLFYALEIVGYSIYYYTFKKKYFQIDSGAKVAPVKRSTYSFALTVIDSILLLTAFVLTTWLKRGHVTVSDDYIDILLVLYGLWLLSAIVTRKFDRVNFSSFYSAIAPCIKSVLFMAAGLAFIIFSLRLFYLSRLQIFGALPILLGFEIVVFYLYYSYRSHGGNVKDIESIAQVHEIHRKEQDDFPPAEEGVVVRDPVEEKLSNALDFLNPTLCKFINDSLDLSGIERDECALIHADNQFKSVASGAKQHRLVVNIQKLNDIRWINQYFLVVYSFLKMDGFIVGVAQTTDARHTHFFKRFPKYLAIILSLLDFIWRRMFPKLPIVQKIYFALTKGQNRLVSRAEILGRLYFCGFKSVAETEIDGRYYFIARKVKAPSLDENPTYGPLVRLKRTGAHNHPITVYKFRTMHPYSEYLQEYVYEKNLLEEGGKFKDDFRVTGWGRFMRKTWLDELPMLYNWITGDLQLVGVRPLSHQYLSLYDLELRELRQKVKPGLIPPFFADMPKTIDEIMDSEKKYIQAYLTNPLKTQWRYFFKCFYNIAIRKARSA